MVYEEVSAKLERLATDSPKWKSIVSNQAMQYIGTIERVGGEKDTHTYTHTERVHQS